MEQDNLRLTTLSLIFVHVYWDEYPYKTGGCVPGPTPKKSQVSPIIAAKVPTWQIHYRRAVFITRTKCSNVNRLDRWKIQTSLTQSLTLHSTLQKLIGPFNLVYWQHAFSMSILLHTPCHRMWTEYTTVTQLRVDKV